eukprot:4463997-Amphidinium_carterae.1
MVTQQRCMPQAACTMPSGGAMQVVQQWLLKLYVYVDETQKLCSESFWLESTIMCRGVHALSKTPCGLETATLS